MLRIFAKRYQQTANIDPRAPLVTNPQIQSATLHNPLPLFLHMYIWPFLAIWPVFFAIYLSEERYNTYIAGSEWTFVWAGSIVTAQSLTWLSTKWNVNIDSLFTSTTTKDVRNAKLIKVIPVTNAGSAEICKLLRDNVSISSENLRTVIDKVYRLVESRICLSCSRSGDSSTTQKMTALRLFPMTSIRSQDRQSKPFKNRAASQSRRRLIAYSSTMETTHSISPFPPSQSYGKSMQSRRSLFFRCSAWVSGCWTTTGTIRCSRWSCWSDSRARLFGKDRGRSTSSAG